MGQEHGEPSVESKTSWRTPATIIGILAAIGLFVGAVLNYSGTRYETDRPIEATQTAEAHQVAMATSSPPTESATTATPIEEIIPPTDTPKPELPMPDTLSPTPLPTRTPIEAPTSTPSTDGPQLIIDDNFDDGLDSDIWDIPWDDIDCGAEDLGVHDSQVHFSLPVNESGEWEDCHILPRLGNYISSKIELRTVFSVGEGEGWIGMQAGCGNKFLNFMMSRSGVVYQGAEVDRTYLDVPFTTDPFTRTLIAEWTGTDTVFTLPETGKQEAVHCITPPIYIKFGAGTNSGGSVSGSIDYIRIWARENPTPTASLDSTGTPDGSQVLRAQACKWDAVLSETYNTNDPHFVRPDGYSYAVITSDKSSIMVADNVAETIDTKYILVVENLPGVQILGVEKGPNYANAHGCWYRSDYTREQIMAEANARYEEMLQDDSQEMVEIYLLNDQGLKQITSSIIDLP